jgi:hypothetical protein
MLVVYTAGPYRNGCEWGVKQNIRMAEDVAVQLWAAGYAVICPHANTNFFGGACGCADSVWLEGDLEIIKRCDIMVVLPGYETSSGTKREIELARNKAMPIYYWEITSQREAVLNHLPVSADTSK